MTPLGRCGMLILGAALGLIIAAGTVAVLAAILRTL